MRKLGYVSDDTHRVTITETVGIPTTLTCLTPPPPTAFVGDEFLFYQELRDASGVLPGKLVTVYEKDYPRIAADTNAEGRCYFSGTWIAAGTTHLQAKFAGDEDYAPSETERYTIVVNEPPF